MKYLKSFIPLLVIALGIALAYLFGLEHYFTFNSLKVHHTALKAALTAHPILAPFLFVLTYTVLIALSLPVSIFLSLLGGYLFPQPLSTLYVVIGATCGATVIFLAARSIEGVHLKARVNHFLKKIKEGFKKNGVRYMLFMRIFPLFPFSVVNIAPAFLGISVKTFIWTTFIGVIPSSFVFTLIGQGLEKFIDTHKSFKAEAIYLTEFKIAFMILAALALLPIFLKKLKRIKK